jgi:hypothetical protein
MRKIYLLLSCICFTYLATAQFNYQAANTSIIAGTYTDLGANGSAITTNYLTGAMTFDDDFAESRPIGFSFNYNGLNFTTFTLSSNGFIILGDYIVDSVNMYYPNELAVENAIYPFAFDLDAGSGTPEYRVFTTGAVGSRVCTIQFKNVSDFGSTKQFENFSFQIKLYETSNNIEFVYGTATAHPTNADGAKFIAVGIKGTTVTSSVHATKGSTTSWASAQFLNGNYSVNYHNIRKTVLPTAGHTIRFTRTIPNDANIAGFSGFPAQSCYNSNQSVSVVVRNTGTSAIAIGAAPITLTVTGANTFTGTVANATSIAANATETITFSGINLNNVGNNNFRAVVNLSGDGNVANDTARTSLSTLSVSNTFPVIDDADGTSLTFGNIRTTNGTRNLWGLNPLTFPSGNYLNSNLSDSIKPKSGTRFYLFDSWSGTSSVGFSGVLYAGCYNIPAFNAGFTYDFSFWMSHDNSFATDLDSMYAVVSTDRGVTWTRVGSYQRYDAAATTPQWSQKTISLVSYAGQTILIGLQGVSKYGNVIAIDDIRVRANNPLPVTLTSFTGKKEGRNNILSWSTANELNNKGFEILRSADGKNFSSIGFEASKNNTTTSATNYSFVDEKALSGANYYQLKQVDKDGKTSLSNIVVLKSNTNKLEISTVYPNPANDKLNAIISSDKEEKVTVSITDLAGKVVNSQQVSTSNGSTNVFFNLQGLSKGTYLLRLTSTKNNEIQIEKFVKQ